jgi:hypothetical protein
MYTAPMVSQSGKPRLDGIRGPARDSSLFLSQAAELPPRGQFRRGLLAGARLVAGMFGGFLLLAAVYAGSVEVHAVIGHAQGGASSHSGHAIRQPFANGNGLVAWYPFDGNTNDASGNGNNGTQNNFTFDGTTNGWVGGKFGSALLFNSSNDYVRVPPSSSINNLAQLTLSFWINPANGGGNQYVVAKGFSLAYASSAKELYFTHYFSVSSGQWNMPVGSVPAGLWTHIVVTYDDTSASNTPMFYVNGVSVATSTPVAPSGTALSDSANPLILGNIGSLTQAVNGSLDDFRMYNRILSATEISQLYQGSQPTNCDQTCVGWWKFDQTSGTTASSSTLTVAQSVSGTVTGKYGNALQFPYGGYMSTATSLTSPNPFTISLWFKTSSNGRLAGFVNGQTFREAGYSRYLYVGTDGKLYFSLYTGSSTVSINSSATYNDGAWHYVAASLSSGGMSLSVDGTQVATNASQTTAQAATGYWALGNGPTSSTNSPGAAVFNGAIDDARIYNVALSPTVVSSIYADASPYPCDSTCVAYWPLDETSGTSASDATGNGDTGTLGNFSYTPVAVGQNIPATQTLLGFTYGTTDGWSTGLFGGGLNVVANDYLYSNVFVTNPNPFTISLWFKSSSVSNPIAEFTDLKGNHDRSIYLNGSGQLTAYVDDASHDTITSPNAYNDGNWHLAAVTLSSAGWILYVDGSKVASNPSATTAQSGYYGTWCFGNCSPNDTSNSVSFSGKLDDARVYSRALAPYEIYEQYAAGRS